MNEETVNVAEAKKHFSEILGQVAFGEKEAVVAGDILAEMRKTGQDIGIEDILQNYQQENRPMKIRCNCPT